MRSEFSETFRGKLLLLVFDKVVIGAMIAAAFFLYDRYKTIDLRNYEASQANVQLSFERSRLLKEFLPLIQDGSVDLTTRAYLLRSAVVSGAIDSETAFELGQDFLRGGLPANHYLRVVSSMLPSGVASFANRGGQIANEWYSTLNHFPDLDSVFDPVSGRENLPLNQGNMITEARLLRAALYENLPVLLECECAELRESDEIPAHLYGMFVLMKTDNLEFAIATSNSTAQGLKTIGMLNRLMLGNADEVPENYLMTQFAGAPFSNENMRWAQVVVAILEQNASEWNNTTSSGIAPILARIAVGELFPDEQTDEEGNLFWLRFNASEGLLAMKGNANSVSDSISVYLLSFAEQVSAKSNGDDLEALAVKFSSGKIIRVLVEVLANSTDSRSKTALQSILDLGEDRLRHFPFLREDVQRSLGVAWEN